MAKILKDTEVLEALNILRDDIDGIDQYEKFLHDLATVLTDHAGGEVGTASYDECDGLGWTVAIQPNDSLPSDGGVFKHFDPDVVWEDRKEKE